LIKPFENKLPNAFCISLPGSIELITVVDSKRLLNVCKKNSIVNFAAGTLFSFLALSSSSALSQAPVSATKSIELERKYEYDCDKIVPMIREDTRMRISVKKSSIEQILKRETVEISDTAIECKGLAITSTGQQKAISYGANIDSVGEWMLSYRLH
jgi:hypothetical protein